MFYMFFSLERIKQPGPPSNWRGSPGCVRVKTKKIKLPAGLEPATYALRMRRSTN